MWNNKIVVLLLSLFFASCCNVEPPPVNKTEGEAFAEVNGELWSWCAYAEYSDNNMSSFSLILDSYENDILEQQFFFKNIPLNLSEDQGLHENINCDNLCASFTTFLEDVIGNNYILNSQDTITDVIHIEEYDNVTHEFKGFFQCSFVRDTSIEKVDLYPDSLEFRNGEFWGIIQE